MPRQIATQAFLANLALFKGLDEAVLARLAASTTARRLRRGECLFQPGDAPTGLHAVVLGRVKLATHDRDGGLVRADLIGSGHTFGEAVLFLERPYVVQATALCDCLVLHIAKDAILRELQQTPAFARRMIGVLAQRIEWLVHERNELAVGSAAQRLVAWLLRRPETAVKSGAAVVLLPASKRVLAARLNSSPEHLSRVLRELAGAGLLHVHGRSMTVPDIERLRAWQDGEVPKSTAGARTRRSARQPASTSHVRP